MKRRIFNFSMLAALSPIQNWSASQLNKEQYRAVRYRIDNKVWLTWHDADCDSLSDVNQKYRSGIWEFCNRKIKLKKPFTVEELMYW